jgi:toxin CptA
MYNAPAVSYPVGRSHFQRQVLIALWLLGAVACAGWAYSAVMVDWRQWLAGSVLALAGFGGVLDLRHTLHGVLTWDGQQWLFSADHSADQAPHRLCPPRAGQLQVGLDLQFVMLLAFCPGSGPALWLWLERKADTVHWLAVRRAVFAQVRPALGKKVAQTPPGMPEPSP